MAFHAVLAGAVADADMVQENTPEDGPGKRATIAAIDRAARPDVVIASSTSGFAMTMLQADCVNPERCVVGHPFNPPYLIPLVEVVGGEQTDPKAVDWLAAFYAAVDKRPLRLTHELPGFVGNRLQEAMWREALHMVAAGDATVEEIDEAIAYGPGLRWALMGPCLTFHLAGGSGGMAAMLDHLGAALFGPWTRPQAPPLPPAPGERVGDGGVRGAGGRAVAEIQHRRDALLSRLRQQVGRLRRGTTGRACAGTSQRPRRSDAETQIGGLVERGPRGQERSTAAHGVPTWRSPGPASAASSRTP